MTPGFGLGFFVEVTMRRCSYCQRCPRQDDPMGTMFFETASVFTVGIGPDSPRTAGWYECCAECRAKRRNEIHFPRRWEVGEQVPLRQGSSGQLIHVCTVCRLALREDEEAVAIRLQPEDNEEWNANFPSAIAWHPIDPGVHLACPSCLDYYRPKIHARLVRIGEISADLPLRALSRNMLL
jgi:hypothetical protein